MDGPSPKKRWGQWAAVAFAMALPTVMTWQYMVGTGDSAGTETALSATQLAYGAAKILQFSFPVVAVLALERRWPRPGVPNFAGLRLGLVFGLLVAAALFVLYFGFLQDTPLLEKTPALLAAKVRDFGAGTPLRFIALGLFISVIHSLLEEYYWRWFVFGHLERLLPLTPALIVSSLGFMSHHVIVLAVYFPDHFWTAALPFSLCVAVGGGVWAWLYHRTGSIYAPWLSHLIVDTAIIAVGYSMLFG
jgi:membrane protease YdiL (CAAX protease family)